MKKLLLTTLSLSLLFATSAQASITHSDTRTLTPQQVSSKALGQNNAQDNPVGYGSMSDIKTPVRAQTEISYPNAKESHSANINTNENSIEQNLARQNMNS